MKKSKNIWLVINHTNKESIYFPSRQKAREYIWYILAFTIGGKHRYDRPVKYIQATSKGA